MERTSRRVSIRGARVHNLKNIDLDLPLGRLVVITGVSGSGKSSLAFDTLHAEGQRRFIETFSAYTRQFLERLDKPDADRIDGIPPSIAVGQHGSRRAPRSTVGTVTEVHESLALLFARTGIVSCVRCGARVRPADPDAVEREIEEMPDRSRYMIAFPILVGPAQSVREVAETLREQGLIRVRINGKTLSLAEDEPPPDPENGEVEVIVDRQVRGSDSESRRRDSIETAFALGKGRCRVITDSSTLTLDAGWRCSACGTDAVRPEPRLFRFNSPLGACPRCEGAGQILTLDLAKVIPDPSLSVLAGALAPFAENPRNPGFAELVDAAKSLEIDLSQPFASLSSDVVHHILEGGGSYQGLRRYVEKVAEGSKTKAAKGWRNRWSSLQTCPDCGGRRLRAEALAVTFEGLTIAEILAMSIEDARALMSRSLRDVATERILDRLRMRLRSLAELGLGYLTLDRFARTLSGGESRRVRLASALGSGLVNTLYVLDEPSIGLHPRDVGVLIGAMIRLRDEGNSLVVVEHEEAVIRQADHLVEVGPGAGGAGGTIVYEGPAEGILSVEGSPTGDFLAGRFPSPVPPRRRAPTSAWIELQGASGHHLDVDALRIPLGLLVVVTGVSGAGKSSIIEETLFPALVRGLGGKRSEGLPFRELRGLEHLREAVLIDQAPIGRTSRSNPVTFLGAYGEIRKTFASQHEAKIRHYTPRRFSFNMEGGRCDRCEGSGVLTVDMQFLADVTVVCPECDGRRFRSETLEVKYRGKSIADVLDLTAREAFGFFRHKPKVLARLRPLLDVGLEYLRLGQPANTLSGGESQRLKLAASLASTPSAITRSASRAKTLSIFDEPTTGLHPADLRKLLDCFHAIADQGHTLVIIEHHVQVMLAADWIIDVGPDAGARGGKIVAEGTPEDVARSGSYTGEVLAEALARSHP